MKHNETKLKVGDVVQHIRDEKWVGVVVEVDAYSFYADVTACVVAWGVTSLYDAEQLPRTELDVQWTNKLCRYDGD